MQALVGAAERAVTGALSRKSSVKMSYHQLDATNQTAEEKQHSLPVAKMFGVTFMQCSRECSALLMRGLGGSCDFPGPLFCKFIYYAIKIYISNNFDHSFLTIFNFEKVLSAEAAIAGTAQCLIGCDNKGHL
jgi:hypothetical protein